MERFELVMRDSGSVLIMNQDANDLLAGFLAQPAELGKRLDGSVLAEDDPLRDDLANVVVLAEDIMKQCWGG
jgi:hypothetical protein